jgi:hypothetical protein
VSPTARLLEVTDVLTEAGLQLLIMGGHAVRHYGVDRNTFDFDFHVSADSAGQLEDQLRRTRLFSGGELKEGVSWRPDDFRRFQIGVLPNGREEWLEFWLRNHLLAPFPQLFERREEALESGRRLCFLSLPDLVRSKETERDDDWSDVGYLEEILDTRNLANATDPAGRASALAQLRSRRGFETAEAQGLFCSHEQVQEALQRTALPVTCAYLIPFTPDTKVGGLDAAVDAVLRRLQPGSARHLAIVEAVRLAYQRAAKTADRADKERHQMRAQNPT